MAAFGASSPGASIGWSAYWTGSSWDPAETWLGTSQAGLWVIGGGALLAAALLALIPSRADIAASAPDSAAGDKPASTEVALA